MIVNCIHCNDHIQGCDRCPPKSDTERVAASVRADADSASLEELEAAADILDCATCEHTPYCLSGGLPTKGCKDEPEAFITSYLKHIRSSEL